MDQRLDRQQCAHQGQRRDDSTHRGDGDRVGQRADQRDLREQEQRGRRKSHSDRPLDAAPLRQPGFVAGPPVRDIENQRNRAERQPESRRKHRPGIDHQDRKQRQGENTRRRRNAPEPQRRRHRAHHEESALGRHAETGKQGIGEGGERPGDGRGLARREHEHERCAAPPAQRHQRGHHSRDERYVQAGDRHEVRYAGAAEKPPVLGVDRVLVADRERGQDSRAGGFAKHIGKTRAHGFADALDAVARAVPFADLHLLAALPYVACCADSALEQPRFVIEAVRVHAAVRALEPDRKQPALAGVHAGGIVEGRGRLIRRAPEPAAVPGEQDLFRQPRAGTGCRFDVELEPHVALAQYRQAGHHAGHNEVTALEVRR